LGRETGRRCAGRFELFVSESDKEHDSGSVGIVSGEATKHAMWAAYVVDNPRNRKSAFAVNAIF
jgi:hypothetical protein